MPNEVSDRLKGEETNFLCPVSLTRRLRVEKIEGGLMVAGVVIAANCQIILPIFGFLFLLIGSVLTAASYRGPGEDEEPAHYAERIAFTGNSRILGPACMVIGFLMLIASFILCILSHRARRREQTVGFHCPVHGDFYPLSPLTSSKTLELIERNSSGKCTFCWPSRKRSGIGAVSAVGPPQCPHSQISSNRSSVASSPHSQQHQCPTPLPFLVNSSAAPSVLASASSNLVHHQQQLPTEHHQSFGSIRSLTVGREIASFPLSRTPSPPPPPLTLNNAQKNIDEQKSLVNEAEFEIVPVHRQGPRKSVSIVLPEDLK